MKTLTKNQNQRRKNSKQNQVLPKGKVSTATAVVLDEAPEQLSAYDSYYKQLSEEVESVERHVRELRQTPGLENLTEAEAHAKVDFMLRFSAWVFNQQLTEQLTHTFADEVEIVAKSAKVQMPKDESNKK